MAGEKKYFATAVVSAILVLVLIWTSEVTKTVFPSLVQYDAFFKFFLSIVACALIYIVWLLLNDIGMPSPDKYRFAIVHLRKSTDDQFDFICIMNCERNPVGKHYVMSDVTTLETLQRRYKKSSSKDLPSLAEILQNFIPKYYTKEYLNLQEFIVERLSFVQLNTASPEHRFHDLVERDVWDPVQNKTVRKKMLSRVAFATIEFPEIYIDSKLHTEVSADVNGGIEDE